MEGQPFSIISSQMREFWPDWILEERIGRGAYGQVFRASRTEFHNTFYCAVKVITVPTDIGEINSLRLEGLDDDSIAAYYSEIISDYINEIRVLEMLKGSSHIVSIEDFKVIRDQEKLQWNIFIRMELLQSLESYLSEYPMLSEDEVIHIALDLCDALSYCEREKIVHRDIKQENVFISQHGDHRDYKLGDFGIAKDLEKATSMYSQKGTYTYMAPEIVLGKDYGPNVDIYSLGMLLYRLMNRNRMPFVRTDSDVVNLSEREEALKRRISGEMLPPPCDAGAALSDVILKACSYAPQERYQTAEELRHALRGVQMPDKQSGTSPGKKYAADQEPAGTTIRGRRINDTGETWAANPAARKESNAASMGEAFAGLSQGKGTLWKKLAIIFAVAALFVISFFIVRHITDSSQQEQSETSAIATGETDQTNAEDASLTPAATQTPTPAAAATTETPAETPMPTTDASEATAAPASVTEVPEPTATPVPTAAVPAESGDEISGDSIISAAAAVYQMAHDGGYTVGDSQATPPCADGKISGDRLISRSLYDLGLTNQPAGGVRMDGMESFLLQNGFVQIWNEQEIQAGDIVVMSSDGTISAASCDIMVIVQYDPATDACVKYDTSNNPPAGAIPSDQSTRVGCDQPFQTVLNEYGGTKRFYCAFRRESENY